MATILAADFGGTKTNLATYEMSGGRLSKIGFSSFPTKGVTSPAELVRRFAGGRKFDAAGLAVAGNFSAGALFFPNLPWPIGADSIKGELGDIPVAMLNDVEAAAAAIDLVDKNSIVNLNEAPVKEGAMRLVVSVGTGFGAACSLLTPNGREVFPSEAGHGDFSPITPLEAGFCSFLAKKYGRASVERAISGAGLVDAHRFLRQSNSNGHCEPLAELRDAREIISCGMEGSESFARDALLLFSGSFGGECGNLALTFLPFSGLYLTGGVALGIGDGLKKTSFFERFSAKGRMSALAASIPVLLLADDSAPLLGAAYAAAKLLRY